MVLEECFKAQLFESPSLHAFFGFNHLLSLWWADSLPGIFGDLHWISLWQCFILKLLSE